MAGGAEDRGLRTEDRKIETEAAQKSTSKKGFDGAPLLSSVICLPSSLSQILTGKKSPVFAL